MKCYSNAIQSITGDEYYSPQNVVDMIVPYISKERFKTIWCPFDKDESNFVKTFLSLGFEVNYGHIETGQDFFAEAHPRGDIVVSNPPFSKRDKIFEKLYNWDIPFALVMNFNGLFDSKKRATIFRKCPPQILVPFGRMKFMHKEKGMLNSPNFQSVYVCHKLLNDKIEFTDDVF